MAGLSLSPRQSRCRGQGLQPPLTAMTTAPGMHPCEPTGDPWLHFGGRLAKPLSLWPRSRPHQLLSMGSVPFKSERRCWERCRALAVQSHGEGDTPNPGDEKGWFGVRCGFGHHLPTPAACRHGESSALLPGSLDPLRPALPLGRGTWHGAALHLLGHRDRLWQTRREGCSPPWRCRSSLRRSLPWEPSAAQPGYNPPQPPLLSRAAPKNLPDLQDIFFACFFLNQW